MCSGPRLRAALALMGLVLCFGAVVAVVAGTWEAGRSGAAEAPTGPAEAKPASMTAATTETAGPRTRLPPISVAEKYEAARRESRPR